VRIVIKEFNKFNKKTLLSKARMPENVRFPILRAERKIHFFEYNEENISNPFYSEMVYKYYRL